MMDLKVQAIEDDLIAELKAHHGFGRVKYRNVFIDCGAANDEITDYTLQIFETSTKRERTVSFRTSACIFPTVIRLSDYESVDTEEYDGSLFIHVH